MTSLFLAKLMGLFMLIIALALLINFHKVPKLVKEFTKNHVLVFASGIPVLLLGLLVVLTHNVWVNDSRVIITIMGWLMILKGIVRLSMPEKLAALISRISPRGYFVLLLITLLLGAYLALFGFYGPELG